MSMSDLWSLEEEIYSELRLASGKKILLCGVDEAGRGPLAGPVCAAAVILPEKLEIPGLDDSKKLSAKKRGELYDVISDSALTLGIAFASVEEIEKYNILNATFLAMSRAIEQLDPVPDLALIDGNRSSGICFPNRCVVKGDARCADISAASVLAKVTRDRYMCDLAERYPQYGFDSHKGYGTAAHYAAIREFGPSPVHRLSFLKKMH